MIEVNGKVTRSTLLAHRLALVEETISESLARNKHMHLLSVTLHKNLDLVEEIAILKRRHNALLAIHDDKDVGYCERIEFEISEFISMEKSP